jgi:hypothetical protein
MERPDPQEAPASSDMAWGRPAVAAARRVRRWPWIVATLLALALAFAAGAVAYQQREVAAEWRDRSESLQAQRDAGIAREDRLTDRLEEITALLASSEEDVVALEGRLRVLADEKAQAEDTATTVQVERDVFTEVTARIVAATEALDGCVERLFDLQTASVDAFNRSTAGEAVDVAPLNATAQQVTSSCNDARTAASTAGAAADRLLAP